MKKQFIATILTTLLLGTNTLNANAAIKISSQSKTYCYVSKELNETNDNKDFMFTKRLIFTNDIEQIKKILESMKCFGNKGQEQLPNEIAPNKPENKDNTEDADNNQFDKPNNDLNKDNNYDDITNNDDNSNEKLDSNFLEEVEQLIYQKVNEERKKVNMPQLSYNSTMQDYARIKSKDMGDNNYFSHEDLSGNLITSTMQNDGVFYNAWGENIAYIGGIDDINILAEQFMTNWMNSKGHRENILSTNYNSIGIGVYKVNNKVYATQEFFR